MVELEKVFENNFKQWVEEDLTEILDYSFENWEITSDEGEYPIMLYVELNDVEEYGRDLDTFLEFQVLGLKFLDSSGLTAMVDYEMRKLLDILPDYLLVSSLDVPMK